MATTTDTYRVGEQGFKSFTAAIAAGHAARGPVIESATGLVRWQPAAPVSAKRRRQHDEQRAAYEAQQRNG